MEGEGHPATVAAGCRPTAKRKVPRAIGQVYPPMVGDGGVGRRGLNEAREENRERPYLRRR